LPKKKVGKEHFSQRRNIKDREDSEDEGTDEEAVGSKRVKRSKPRKKVQIEDPNDEAMKGEETKEENKTDFEKVLDKIKKACAGTILRIATLIGCGLMVLVTFIRFAYLGKDFSFFYMVQVFFLLFMIMLIVFAEDVFPKRGQLCRTYFNLLDSNYGRGLFMLYLCVILFERTEKGEEFFAVIVLIIAVFNICIGYSESGLKELPMNPWNTEEEIELEKNQPKIKAEDKVSATSSDTSNGSEIDLEANAQSKRAKELNKKKEKIEKKVEKKNRSK